VLPKQTLYALILWRGAHEDAAGFLDSDWLWQRETGSDDDQLQLLSWLVGRRPRALARRVSEVIGGLPQIVPKKQPSYMTQSHDLALSSGCFLREASLDSWQASSRFIL
jgi:hypothetical protein